MLKKFAKFIIGIFLIPACIGFSKGYIEWISSIPINALSYNQKYFLYGLLVYLLIHIIFRRPLSVYVFGHELTHAIWAKIFGGEVKDLKVSSKGGEVKTTKSNVVITLAPYFFPIYTLIILIIFGIVSVFSKNYQNYMPYYLFLVGFSLAFHILLTIEMIRSDQPDIKEHGFIFSLSIIYFINLIIVSLLSKMIFSNEQLSTYLAYLNKSALESKAIYMQIFSSIQNVSIKTYNYVNTIYKAFSNK